MQLAKGCDEEIESSGVVVAGRHDRHTWVPTASEHCQGYHLWKYCTDLSNLRA